MVEDRVRRHHQESPQDSGTALPFDSKEHCPIMAENLTSDSHDKREAYSEQLSFRSQSEQGERRSSEVFSEQAQQEVKPESDLQLALAARRGDTEAMEKIYERYVDVIYRYAIHKTNSKSDAEALTSEAFMRAIAGLVQDQYTPQNIPFIAWLLGIARNVYFEWQRAHSRDVKRTTPIEQLPEGQHPNEPEDTLEALITQEKEGQLWKLVKELPLTEQKILKLRYVYGLSHAEIGQKLNLSENAAKQRHYRALRWLKARLLTQSIGDEA